MKKTLITAISAVLFLFVSSGSALAQEEEGEKITVTPVEAFVCKYKDGKGWDDLNKVNEKWNAWADDRDLNDYFAVNMFPHFHSDFESLDFVWVGAYRNGNAMGAGTDAWLNEGGDLAEQYAEMSSCSTVASFIGMTLRPPKDDGDDESDNQFVVSFSDCSLTSEEDGAWDEFMAANNEWNAYADEHGIAGSRYLWWPSAGESPDADYDFKLIGAWDDHTMRGATWQQFADGHWQKDWELFNDKLDCNSSRMYNAWVVREMGDEE